MHVCVCGAGYITHLRKLEKAATVAFMEMPMSAMARLKTRKLLGVLSSRTLMKDTIVTAFKKKPSRPCGGNTQRHHGCGSRVNGGHVPYAHHLPNVYM